MGETFMLTQEVPGVRTIQTAEEFSESRLEAIGFIFHGTLVESNGKRNTARSSVNLLHFARCAKLEKVGDGETKIWFRSIRVAVKYLEDIVGRRHWKWCKVCEREITQRILDEV
jgi:hypothetical protein